MTKPRLEILARAFYGLTLVNGSSQDIEWLKAKGYLSQYLAVTTNGLEELQNGRA